MRRRLFTILAATSLVLCVAACVMWVRSFRKTDEVTRLINGERYTFCSANGRLTIVGPPPAARTTAVERAAAAAVADIRNGDVSWIVSMHNARFVIDIEAISRPTPRPGTASAKVEQAFKRDDVARALLAALEDPNRFAAAHMLLCRGSAAWREPYSDWEGKHPSDNPVDNRAATYDAFHRSAGQVVWARVDHDGLTVDLRLSPDQEAPSWSGSYAFEFVGHPRPADLPTVREAWHRRLGVTRATLPYRRVVAGTTVLPGVGIMAASSRAIRARRRRRSGRCFVCGYNLRATPGRCPECGAAQSA